MASSSDIESLYSDSNTAIAASEPEPIDTYGRLSVEPCGYTCAGSVWDDALAAGGRGRGHEREKRRARARARRPMRPRTHRVEGGAVAIEAAEDERSRDVPLVLKELALEHRQRGDGARRFARGQPVELDL